MKTGFIFPGQGSQSVGMLADLAESFDVVIQTFAQASEVLGYDLWKVVSEGPDTELNKTECTQPALLTAGVAVYRVLKDKAATPSIMAGHSLGEYTALVCAEALAFTDAVSLVADRGRFMQEAAPAGAGAMAAILGLDDDVVEQVCASTESGIVSCANYNSPGQIVIAGEHAAVEVAIEALKEAGAKRALMLPVSVPSHCSLMKPAADALAERLFAIEVKSPTVRVIHNVDAQTHSEPTEIKQVLIEQLYKPVRWVDVMTVMSAQSDQVIESGPGKVLAGLCKRIDRKLTCLPVYDPSSLEKALT